MLPVAAYWRVVLIGVLISSVIWLLMFRESLGRIPGLGYASQLVHVEPDTKLAPPEATNFSDPPRLILYSYAESKIGRRNLEYFLDKGLHGAADFIFIFNGETDAASLVPDLPNVKVIRRENKCFDLGGMGEILRKNDLWKQYKRFITMNASIRGPFFPRYDRTSCWSDVFLDRVTEATKLVGTTVNCDPSPHIQSMLWATDSVGMGILLDPELAHSVPQEDHWGRLNDPVGLSFCHETMDDAIHSEIGSTRLITSQGYGIDVLMTAFELSEGSGIGKYCEVGQPADLLREGRYYGSNIHPYETIFFKSNREIDPNLIDKLTDWHLKSDLNSWKTCK
ncbi:hypothetical protein DHEL01_v208094 [Diaporthe helianthi]|uniref:Uncharacterized protein n=1 Tax=Diaporthe helianthi TaxID=158607 RepID=A0A2P5HTD1_DIAHE|nr:hypothetical protein DHEL01_v208094 [Diaporthe helianthi]